MPFRRWKTEHRSLKVNDVVLVLYDKKIGKGDYKLGRIIAAHPDSHGVVRTVTVGLRLRGKDKDTSLTYVPKALDELRLGVQRVAVICPAEEQPVSDEGEALETVGSRKVSECQS